ncbi:DNA alkylation repair protein [Cryobacterium psychrophilum]|uniref:Uncharacterized protein n=1 Tax=Cryobacterium psychrophilum TaxID=41988 RepID=A0A4Y8KK89_9MICO|nr:DNA alkylation repair protein [Cryobacterium psychrophilum]TFD75967.1 hypothetical protein E3T53_14355 [Cryobacterium psychrophilum]
MTDAARTFPASLTACAVKGPLGGLADPEFAEGVARFFQTGPVQYADGDVFLGLKVPVVGTSVKAFAALPQAEIDVLLESEVHEH